MSLESQCFQKWVVPCDGKSILRTSFPLFCMFDSPCCVRISPTLWLAYERNSGSRPRNKYVWRYYKLVVHGQCVLWAPWRHVLVHFETAREKVARFFPESEFAKGVKLCAYSDGRNADARGCC